MNGISTLLIFLLFLSFFPSLLGHHQFSNACPAKKPRNIFLHNNADCKACITFLYVWYNLCQRQLIYWRHDTMLGSVCSFVPEPTWVNILADLFKVSKNGLWDICWKENGWCAVKKRRKWAFVEAFVFCCVFRFSEFFLFRFCQVRFGFVVSFQGAYFSSPVDGQDRGFRDLEGARALWCLCEHGRWCARCVRPLLPIITMHLGLKNFIWFFSWSLIVYV